MMRSAGVSGLLALSCFACGGSDGPEGTTNDPALPATVATPAVPIPDVPRPATTTPLPRSTPEAEGIGSEVVLGLVSALDSQVQEPHSLMLLRHGKVVAEAWWSPYTAGDMHTMYSVTKSFNSTAVGMAVAEGLLGVDELVTSFFPDLAATAPAFQTMTVRHLLTMSTGHAADTIDRMRAAGNEWTQAFLSLPVENAPGSEFIYNSGAAYVLGAIVQKVTGMTVEEYLGPRLFEPLGISNRLWGQSPEGINMTDGGLSVTTEELAKFGQLYLQNGMWEGQAIIEPQWVTDATAKQVDTYPGYGNWNFGYGYQFWRSQVGYRADGSLGQFCFVIPEQDLVLALTSGTNNDGGTNRVMNVVFQYLSAELPETLPEDPAAYDALTAKLASLALAVPDGAGSSPLSADVSGKRYQVAANSQGITAFQIAFSEAPPVLTIEDANGSHAIPVGIGQWVRARTGFKQRINELFDVQEQAVSAIGAWTTDSTFVAKLAFTETPYTMDTTFVFNGDQVTVDVAYNVRWGSLTEPQLTGTRAAPAPALY
jgi:CubicO group peptidase (beta-lactamase class C family)